MNKKTLFITQSGMIAALYVALTMISALFNLSSGVIQCRLSEILCVLPVYNAAAIPGVTVGCIVANLITTGSIYDIVLGSLATLIGALGAHLLRHGKLKYIASLPTIFSNALIVPIILILSGINDATGIGYVFTSMTVAAGEVISCGILGTAMLIILSRYNTKLFRKNKTLASK